MHVCPKINLNFSRSAVPGNYGHTQNEGQNTAVVGADSYANGDRLSSFFKVHTVVLFCSHYIYAVVGLMQSLYYNETGPLTLPLVRRLHRGVRRHQRIPQLAHSSVT